MAKTVTARERIYISCRSIFSGRYAHIRNEEMVEELVHKNQASLAAILGDISQDTVIVTVRSLLELRVFESEARAKLEFPTLFCSSRLHYIQRELSESSAAESVAEHLEEIVSYSGSNVKRRRKVTDFESSDVSHLARQEQEELFSLYPSYLPFGAQHRLLKTAKMVLEDCCFDFALDLMPHILRERQWRCPVEAELKEWISLFGNDNIQLHPAALELTDENILTEIANMSRVVLDRLPIPARVVNQLLKSATHFCRTLQCGTHTAQLEKLQDDVNSKIKAMELNKDYLQHAASERLRETEKHLMEETLKQDQHNQSQVGQLLVDSVNEIFGVQWDVNRRVPRQLDPHERALE